MYYIERRMGLAGYAVNYRSLECHPYQHPGGFRHLIVAGTSRAEPFPWDEVERLAAVYDSATPWEEAESADPDVVSLPVAKAVVEVVAWFVRGAVRSP